MILYVLYEVFAPYFDIFQWSRNRYVKHIWFDLNIKKANVITGKNLATTIAG